MYFSDEDYELIMNEIMNKKLCLDKERGDIRFENHVKDSPALAYYRFREAFPTLNDEYDMRYDAHVVYYAFYHYHSHTQGIKYPSLLKIRFESDALIEYIHNANRDDVSRRICRMKADAKK